VGDVDSFWMDLMMQAVNSSVSIEMEASVIHEYSASAWQGSLVTKMTQRPAQGDKRFFQLHHSTGMYICKALSGILSMILV
jgi:hypothetical protein